MVKVYGIKTCGSVRKALAFFESKGVEYQFVDFKKEKPTQDKLEFWLKFVSLEQLFNKKGTTYKKLGLKDCALGAEEMKQWLLKEPLLFKRPVVEICNPSPKSVIVGFSEEAYEKIC